jgi:hypothetical protein
MKNKTILIIMIGAIAVILAVVVLVILFNKKTTTTSVVSPPTTTTGSGKVSTGASPDLVVVGSGVVNVVTPKSDPTQPYATTAPRVEPAITASNGSGTALQPTSTASQSQSASSSEVAYNYNQSDDSFLNDYYPDAQVVIAGGDGPAGNAGQDPSNQVLYTTAPVDQNTGPGFTAPTDGFNPTTLPTSTNNSQPAITNYLNQLASTTASFDIVNNSSLVTAPLQSLDASAAATANGQAQAVLTALQALVVPSDLVDLQASYVDAYQQFISYDTQLAAFLNSGATNINSQSAAIENAVTTVSNSLNSASSNYQAAISYYEPSN